MHYCPVHRRRKLLKAGGAQEVVINFELFTRAKLLCGRGRHVKVGGHRPPVPPRFLRLWSCDVCVCTCMGACACVCVCVLCMCMCVCVCARMVCACMHLCVYTCAYPCVHVFVNCVWILSSKITYLWRGIHLCGMIHNIFIIVQGNRGLGIE